jgi:hypothetical protein
MNRTLHTVAVSIKFAGVLMAYAAAAICGWIAGGALMYFHIAGRL